MSSTSPENMNSSMLFHAGLKYEEGNPVDKSAAINQHRENIWHPTTDICTQTARKDDTMPTWGPGHRLIRTSCYLVLVTTMTISSTSPVIANGQHQRN